MLRDRENLQMALRTTLTDESQRANVVNALKSTRPIKPGENNWLLFSALVEAALWQLTGLLHLGLPADDPFWTAPPADWTQKRLW
jgi:hypothetical protein